MRILVPLAALTVASCGTPAARPAAKEAPFALEAKLDQVVTVEGLPEDAKLGAVLLIGGARTVWIDGLGEWPPELRGKPVEVTGKVIERADLPVYVHEDGAPEKAGVAVGAEVDLARARRRFLLTGARWKLVE